MLRRSIGTLGLATMLVVTAGCTSNGGFLGTDYHPRGDITVSDPATGAALVTSPTSPYLASTGFSIAIHETDFNGPYSVKIVKWENNFSLPCFTVAQSSPTIYTFSIGNANPPTDPVTQANPCGVVGDIEQAEIDDGDGHIASFYLYLQGSTETAKLRRS